MIQPFHYNIHDLLWLKVLSHGPVTGLHRKLASFEAAPAGQAGLELTIHRHWRNLPTTMSPHLSGYYKGIPWRLCYDRSENGRLNSVHFFSPCFVTFLVMRLILIPLVREILINHGGVALPGTAFRWQGTTWHVYGRPGVGKTALLLEALNKGGDLIGDFELLVFPGGSIRPFGDQLEFRYATIRPTPHWKQLTAKQQWWLHCCRLISLATARRISFNLTVPASQVGSRVVADSTDGRRVLVALDFDVGDWNADLMVEELLAYYFWYDSTYEVALCRNRDQRDRKLASNFREYLQNCELVALPARVSLDQLPL